MEFGLIEAIMRIGANRESATQFIREYRPLINLMIECGEMASSIAEFIYTCEGLD